jgi:hypothetical protein
MDLVAKALEWARLNETLKDARLREAAARAELLEAAFPAGVERGTNRAILSDKYTLKAVRRPEPKVVVDKLRAALAKLCGRGPVGELLADRLVRWKPELSVAEFDKLEAKDAKLFAAAVEIKLGAAAVELVEA